MTSETGPEGYYVLKNHALVAFRFTGVHDTDLENLEPEPTNNILFALEISPPDANGAFRVTLESVMNKDGAFSATHGEVVSVTRYEPVANNQ